MFCENAFISGPYWKLIVVLLNMPSTINKDVIIIIIIITLLLLRIFDDALCLYRFTCRARNPAGESEKAFDTSVLGWYKIIVLTKPMLCQMC